MTSQKLTRFRLSLAGAVAVFVGGVWLVSFHGPSPGWGMVGASGTAIAVGLLRLHRDERRRVLGLGGGEEDPPGGTSRGVGLLVLALVPVLAVLVLLGSRGPVAARDRAAVHVVADAEALVCDGTSVEHLSDRRPDSVGVVAPIAMIEPGMRCEYSFWVTNEGREPVQLRQVSFPLLGPSGGLAVEAVSLNGFGPDAAEEQDGPVTGPPDAVFNVEWALTPGRSAEFTLVIADRPGGCTSSDGTLVFRDTPTLTLRSRGVTGERSAESIGFGVRGHPTGDCDDP